MSDQATACSTSECGQPATVLPVVLVYGPGGRGCAPTEFKLPVCNACKATLTLSDFDSEDFRKHVGQVLDAMGSAQPDWSLNRLTFKLIRDSAFRGLKEV